MTKMSYKTLSHLVSDKPIYKPGTKFEVCDHIELLNRGWKQEYPKITTTRYKHDDYPELLINYEMIEDHQGKTLTVSDLVEPGLITYSAKRWYNVEENNWRWPVASFLENDLGHTCEEGMTPICGWVICKHCGDNIREVK